MQCPSCKAADTKVADSRLAEDGVAIRRRRQCTTCSYRFTTFERVDEVALVVVKSDGRTEPYDRLKVEAGIRAASKGRGITDDAISLMVNEVEDEIRSVGSPAQSAQVGIAVLDQLRRVDEVAYLRFASVYKEFDGATDFNREIELLTKQARSAPNG